MARGSRPTLLTFGGQDPRWAESLTELLRGRIEVRRWCESALREMGDLLAERPRLHPGLAAAGIEPGEWLDGGRTWSAPERASGHLCFVGSLLGHVAAARVLAESGIGVGPDPGGVAATTGHSSGLLAAWLVSRHGSDIPARAAAEAMVVSAVMARSAALGGEVADPDELAGALRGETAATPMLALSGPTEKRLGKLLAEHATGAVEVSLQNSWDRWVLSGPGSELSALAETLVDNGDMRVEAVASSCGYHHSGLADAAEMAVDLLEREGLGLDAELSVPLVDPRDCTSIDPEAGRDPAADLTTRVVESVLVHPVRWADTMHRCASEVDTVIDVGPSTVAAAFTRRALQGSGVTVIAAGDPAGRRSLVSAAEWPSPTEDWSAWRPAVETGPAHHLRTRHTERTQRSSFVLAGMTPTTVDVGIVAAAANSGHVAELAGGGQVNREIFEQRVEELVERLSPGQEVVFNALHLDPYLWGLHLGRERLVQKARAAGAPICGVTISAGIPEVDEAVELLEELNDLGIWLNAFKPGDVAGVRRVLEIASNTDAPVWLHLEGGLAGGHHSWGDLEDVLFATYAEIRRHDNVTLLVGGGVDGPQRAADLIGGGWSLAHCPWRMPVDGVLIGTVAMACAESTASAPVKAALVAAEGFPGTVRAGEARGGVTSGWSGLGADIHYLDNHAARVAVMLHEVAGDAEAVAERHDEIAEALSRTAKPWFGDLAAMTWAEALERYVELCALGTHGRYEDGRWLDRTHRTRFLSLLRRAEQRCVDQDQGPFRSAFAGPADLDDPDKALDLLRTTHPLVDEIELTPSDVAAVIEVCDQPGKPVPFVVAIDENVRKRYLTDSLWQAHTDRWDAEEVLVIPGPRAVAGIERADEPVASLLDRFDSEVAGLLAEQGALVLAEPRAARSAVESLLQLHSVRRGRAMVPSPVRLLDPDGSGWTFERDGDRSIAVLQLGSERAVLSGPPDPVGRVELSLEWPPLAEVAGEGRLCLAFEVEVDHGVVVASLDGEVLRSGERQLLSMLREMAQTLHRQAESANPPTEGTLLDPTPVPDAAMARLWAPVFSALEEDGAAEGLLSLVHARHRIELDDRADGGGPRAELVLRDHVEAGRRLRVRSSDRPFVVLDDFLVRDGAPGGPEELGSGSATADISPGDASPGGAVAEGKADWIETPRSFLGRRRVRSPRHPEAFAAVSGDANPIHRSELVARLAGLPGRIVHGMWTSAAAQAVVIDEVLDGDAGRLVSWDIQFLDVVLPGVELDITATRVGAHRGNRRIEVRIESSDGVVAMAHAEVTAPRTAYVFPGQGIQSTGMGLDALERSPAARHTWERADSYCRSELGFSVLEVVRDNPHSLVVGTETFRHPAGVLHLTQFTQVAMATLAAAQVEELREAGVLVPDAVVAGHSVGEYNALASAGGVLPLEAVLGIVWARGNAMHNLVPRDEDGSSGYRLGVVRPHLAGVDAAGAAELVEAVAVERGELCQIVNHNLRGRQYAVAGTVGALAELEERLGGDGSGRAPFLLVPGIDVPFHSRALVDGVADFRAHLDEALPEQIDPGELLGRYVPNLHPEPFSIDRSYVEAVSAACDGRACVEILADWDDLVERPGRLTRELLVELLAWQFASPVRWIESTDVLLGSPQHGGLGVQRVVEVGIGSAPTLTNLTRAAVAAEGHRGVEVLHLEADRAAVFEADALDEPPVESFADSTEHGDPLTEGDPSEDWDGDAPAPASDVVTGTPESPPAAVPKAGAGRPAEQDAPEPAAPAAAAAAAADPEDQPVSVSDAVGALLAHLTHLRPDQLGDDTVDELVDGASSRRNQVLMDLGKEFGVGSVEGAHEVSRSELVERLTPMVRSHRHPGPVLAAAISAGLGAALGPMGQGPGFVGRYLRDSWGLGEGWVQQCELELFLGTREGNSRRGGELATLPVGSDAEALVDAALAAAGNRLGVQPKRPEAATSSAVDGVELQQLRSDVSKAVAEAARVAMTTLDGVDPAASERPAGSADEGEASADHARLAVLDLEHGADRAREVAPIFRPRRVRRLDSALAWARADLDHLFHDGLGDRTDATERILRAQRLAAFWGSDERFDSTVRWYLQRAEAHGDSRTAALFEAIARGPSPEQRRSRSRLGGRTVLLSGASPGSIAEATAAELLSAGATVVMVTHSGGRARRLAVRELVRRHSGPGACLFLVPANLASFTDIDRLVDWLAESRTDGGPGLPDVVLPFAAAPVAGDVPDSGAANEVEMRVLLLGVERLLGRLSEAVGATPGAKPLTAVLPMSPNHGGFGGDGSYGAAKAGLEVLEARRRSEFSRWGRHCHVLGAEIGWVRGTGLMAANDSLAAVVEQQLGVRTWSAAEMGSQIAELCAPPDMGGPVTSGTVPNGDGSATRVDLTGGLSEVLDSGALARLLREGLPGSPDGPAARSGDASGEEDERELAALPTPRPRPNLGTGEWPSVPDLDADDLVVICGTAEIGPWGTASTRVGVEQQGAPDAQGTVELALACGLVEWIASGSGGEYVDTDSGDAVAEEELVERYRDEVLGRCGIRRTGTTYDQDVEVFLDRPVTIGLDDREAADAFAAATPGTVVRGDGDRWALTLPPGSPLRLRRSRELPRDVTAPIPDGMAPTAFGVPTEMAESIDRVAAWNLAVTAEAFRDAGTTPEEILGAVHTSRVANSQGTGMGGMDSLRGLNLDPALGRTHPNDLLQEALGNVPSAYAMQSLVGGYGPMVHPVAACATAAVSLEVALDMVRLDKADVVVAGGFDDLSDEGVIGFADMSATADSAQMAEDGFEPEEMSRPGDRDRAGFVEGQGGGTMLVCRGRVARRLGLPVRAVVGLARSYSDGVQESIPAPGLGALAVAVGGRESPLARALAEHGLDADDIAFVSKHDTSTRANDPNEAAIHEQIATLLGRSEGNPLRVVSQKALTGHAKGGSAAWQIAGICDVFASGVVPGNPNLDSVDPDVQAGPLVPDDRALHTAVAPRAALLSSLGFGHVSAVVLLVHPDAFVAALPEAERERYLSIVVERTHRSERLRRWSLHGGVPAYRRPRGRRLGEGEDDDLRRREIEVLSDPTARLGPAGSYQVGSGSTGPR